MITKIKYIFIFDDLYTLRSYHYYYYYYY